MIEASREASLPEYIAMLGNSDHKAAQEYHALIKGITTRECDAGCPEHTCLSCANDLVFNLRAENAKLVIESTDYKSSMEYWVEEYNKKNSENAKLKSLAEPLTIALYNEMSERHTVVCKEKAKLRKALKKYGEH
jgi:hypothetical protein